MKKADTLNRLMYYLRESYPNDSIELKSDTDLLDDWFTDSLDIIEMVMFIEEEFGILVQRADITGENFKDVSALCDFVNGRIGS